MNTLHYIQKSTSFFMETIYPSGKRTGKCRITKNDYTLARKYAIENSEKLEDLEVTEFDFCYTEIKR